MSLLLRKLRINRKVSFVIGSLFAFAPYHFYRYLSRDALTDYISVPIAMYLAFNILGIIEDKERELWLNNIQNGEPRENIFYSFLN